MPSVAMSQRFNAPIEEVYAAVTEHTMLADMLPLIDIAVVKKGEDSEHGLNSVRAMGIGVIKPLKEQVTLSEPPYRLEYKVVGLVASLLNHHRGVLIFTEDGKSGNNTLVVWHIELKTKPAFLSALVLNSLKRGIKKGLSKKAKQMRENR